MDTLCNMITKFTFIRIDPIDHTSNQIQWNFPERTLS